ncbi:MAG: hypothetical protein ACRC0G_12195, partial [Fusobacteriaceae bacterium]
SGVMTLQSKTSRWLAAVGLMARVVALPLGVAVMWRRLRVRMSALACLAARSKQLNSKQQHSFY